MKKILLITLLNFNLVLFSQESKLSIELNYPIPVDNNFIGKNYTGIVDIGGKYKIINKEVINFGIALNAGLLTFNNSKITRHRITKFMHIQYNQKYFVSSI